MAHTKRLLVDVKFSEGNGEDLSRSLVFKLENLFDDLFVLLLVIFLVGVTTDLDQLILGFLEVFLGALTNKLQNSNEHLWVELTSLMLF